MKRFFQLLICLGAIVGFVMVSGDYYNVPITLGANVVQNITLSPTLDPHLLQITQTPLNDSVLEITQISNNVYQVSNPTPNVVSGYIPIIDQDWDMYSQGTYPKITYGNTQSYYSVGDLLNRNFLEDMGVRFPYIIPLLCLFSQIFIYINDSQKSYWKSIISVALLLGVFTLLNSQMVILSLVNGWVATTALIFTNIIMIVDTFYNKKN